MTVQELIDQLSALPAHQKSWPACISDGEGVRIGIDKVEFGSGVGGAFIGVMSCEPLSDDTDFFGQFSADPGNTFKAEETARG